MFDVRFWRDGLAAFIAVLAALAGAAALGAWLVRRRRHNRVVTNVLRLALDIVDVAATVDEDLDRVCTERTYPDVRAKCREYRDRAEAILAHRERLARLPSDRVVAALELLHDDHRRMVNLRSEADAVLAGRPFRGHASRASRSVSQPRSHPSAWHSSGFHTRPSTL
jgi:hypothetical protein